MTYTFYMLWQMPEEPALFRSQVALLTFRFRGSHRCQRRSLARCFEGARLQARRSRHNPLALATEETRFSASKTPVPSGAEAPASSGPGSTRLKRLLKKGICHAFSKGRTFRCAVQVLSSCHSEWASAHEESAFRTFSAASEAAPLQSADQPQLDFQRPHR